MGSTAANLHRHGRHLWLDKEDRRVSPPGHCRLTETPSRSSRAEWYTSANEGRVVFTAVQATQLWSSMPVTRMLSAGHATAMTGDGFTATQRASVMPLQNGREATGCPFLDGVNGVALTHVLPRATFPSHHRRVKRVVDDNVGGACRSDCLRSAVAWHSNRLQSASSRGRGSARVTCRLRHRGAELFDRRTAL